MKELAPPKLADPTTRTDSEMSRSESSSLPESSAIPEFSSMPESSDTPESEIIPQIAPESSDPPTSTDHFSEQSGRKSIGDYFHGARASVTNFLYRHKRPAPEISEELSEPDDEEEEDEIEKGSPQVGSPRSRSSSPSIKCPLCSFESKPEEMTKHIFGLVHSDDMLTPSEQGKSPDGSYYCTASYKEFTDSRFHRSSEFRGTHVSLLPFQVDKFAGVLVLTCGEKIRCGAFLCALGSETRGWKCTVECNQKEPVGPQPNVWTAHCVVQTNLTDAILWSVTIPTTFWYVQEEKIYMRLKVNVRFTPPYQDKDDQDQDKDDQEKAECAQNSQQKVTDEGEVHTLNLSARARRQMERREQLRMEWMENLHASQRAGKKGLQI